MKIETMNTPSNSVNFDAAQLEIPFAQPESQSIQTESQTTIPIAQPKSKSETQLTNLNLITQPKSKGVNTALREKVERQAEEMGRQKVEKKKGERVKAAFNLMDYIVKYYNTGETYISRVFTLVGMVSLIALGANRVTTLEGGVSTFVPPLDIFPDLLANLQPSGTTASPASSGASKAPPMVTPMVSSSDQVTRLQPALVSPSFTLAQPPSSESAPTPENVPTPASTPTAPSESLPVENAPWVSPIPEIPPVSLPLPEVNAPIPTSIQAGVQQVAEQLNPIASPPEIAPPQSANISEVQQGVQQAAEQLGQIAPPSIPIGADSIPAIPDVPAGIGGLFGGNDD